MDYLMRDQAPLTAEEWRALDEMVVQVARRNLVARRFLNLVGPLGPSVQSIAADVYEAGGGAQIGLFGAEEKATVEIRQRRFVPLPMLYRDFVINWRDLESWRSGFIPREVTGPAIAASLVSALEDRTIFSGSDEHQQMGFLNVEGHQTRPLGDWSAGGAGFEAAVQAVQALTGTGFRRPYTMIVPPQLLAALTRVFNDTGVLEIDQVQRLIGGYVYMTQTLPANTAVVVAAGQENMDLVLGQDMAVAFLETTSMEHHFRVLETVSLRIKRPDAVVVLK